MTDADALALFRRWVNAFQTKKQAADALGISRPYITGLYSGNRPLTDTLLEKIGLVRKTTITRKAG